MRQQVASAQQWPALYLQLILVQQPGVLILFVDPVPAGCTPVCCMSACLCVSRLEAGCTAATATMSVIAAAVDVDSAQPAEAGVPSADAALSSTRWRCCH